MIVDRHEPPGIPEALRARGCPVEVRAIHPGDYVVGPVGVERKTLDDLFASIVRRRLFEQVRRLRETYPLALVLVEGDLNTIAARRNPAAFWGAFAAVTLGERVPILFTPDRAQTVVALHTLEKRFAEGASSYGLRHKPPTDTLEERQRFLLEGLPGIGEVRAERLLERFGTPRRALTASATDLQRVEGIGAGRAREIAAVLDTPYRGGQRRLEGVVE